MEPDYETFVQIDADLVDNHIDLKNLMILIDDYMSAKNHAASLKSLNKLYSQLEIINGEYVRARNILAKIKREIQ